MSLSNTFFEKLEELEALSARLEKSAAVATPAATIELYPNRYEELSVERPFYLENAILTTAAAEEYNPMDAKQIKLIREKKNPVKHEDMIERAHPVSVYLSNALGDGGLLENQNEQHAKIMEVVHKLPTGNFVHIYAEVLNELVKIAEDLESSDPEAAAKVDEAIAAIAGREQLELEKKAFSVKLVGGILSGLAALGLSGAGMWNAIKGRQENLVEDTQDLVTNIESWKDDKAFAVQKPLSEKIYSTAQQMHELASQLLSSSSDLAIKPTPELEQQVNDLDAKFGGLLTQLKLLNGTLTKQLPGSFFPSFHGKIEDVQADYDEFNTQLVGAAQHKELAKTQQGGAGHTLVGQADQGRIKAVQEYLNKNGFGPLELTGQPDDHTELALVEFVKYINQSSMQDGQLKRGLGVRNLTSDKLVSMLPTQLKASQLSELVDLFQNPAAYINTQ